MADKCTCIDPPLAPSYPSLSFSPFESSTLYRTSASSKSSTPHRIPISRTRHDLMLMPGIPYQEADGRLINRLIFRAAEDLLSPSSGIAGDFAMAAVKPSLIMALPTSGYEKGCGCGLADAERSSSAALRVFGTYFTL